MVYDPKSCYNSFIAKEFADVKTTFEVSKKNQRKLRSNEGLLAV